MAPIRLAPWLWVLFLLVVLASVLPAQEPAAASSQALPDDHRVTRDSGSLLDREDVADFLDGFITAQLAENHVAGATVAVIQADQTIVAQGYGLADVEDQIPVDPTTTMFRIGSVSKLFIWTSVMQLVQQGKIDLDTDVNAYLSETEIQIPASFEQPITMRDLMSHTSGFEDVVIGLFAKDETSLAPISELMRQQMPRRVRPAGDLAAYSNHGTLLAAVILQQVAGTPWEDFVREHILGPLDMTNTLLLQPPRDRLPESLSVGYSYDGRTNEFRDEGFEYIPAAPAGCISASAQDMAHFMIAHVNHGQFSDRRILSPQMVDAMHSRSRWHDERLDAMCHGFWELHRNGVRILEHGGDTNLFHSLMMIVPERQVGLFVSYNTETAGPLRERLRNAFLDRYFPSESKQPVPPAGFSEHADRFAGRYKLLRYDHSGPGKLAMLLQNVPVSVRPDDRLSIGGRDYIQVEPLMFSEEHGPGTAVFREDDAGEITHLFFNRAPAIALERMRWFESPRLHLGILASAVVICLAAVFGWPLVQATTQGLLIDGNPPTRISRLASWYGWLMAAGFLAGWVCLGLEAQKIVYGIPPLMQAVLILSPLLGVATGLLVLLAAVAVVRRYWRFSGRLHYVLLASAAVASLWQMWLFNLIRWDW